MNVIMLGAVRLWLLHASLVACDLSEKFKGSLFCHVQLVKKKYVIVM
jgi:hypothetical protein